jgi:hypothetical protein
VNVNGSSALTPNNSPLHQSRQAERRHQTDSHTRQRRAIGFVGSLAAYQQFRRAIIEMLCEFFNDGGLARWWELQIRQPPSDFRFPVRHRCATLGFRTA